mmetsp:Transcript_7027/g.20307  ORF Transcript_7027/g.20307 Transcript_7027/m.20307 type:complete len:201 (+) Transcript_7027:325-927(+)
MVLCLLGEARVFILRPLAPMCVPLLQPHVDLPWLRLLQTPLRGRSMPQPVLSISLTPHQSMPAHLRATSCGLSSSSAPARSSHWCSTPTGSCPWHSGSLEVDLSTLCSSIRSTHTFVPGRTRRPSAPESRRCRVMVLAASWITLPRLMNTHHHNDHNRQSKLMWQGNITTKEKQPAMPTSTCFSGALKPCTACPPGASLP